MNCNVGTADRIIRVVLGAIILAAGFVYQSWWGLIGLIPLGTAAAGRCMLYVPFGINTCKIKTPPPETPPSPPEG